MTNIEWIWIVILPAIFMVTFLLTYRVSRKLNNSLVYSIIGFVLANLVIPIADATFNLRLYAIGYIQGFIVVAVFSIGISMTLIRLRSG